MVYDPTSPAYIPGSRTWVNSRNLYAEDLASAQADQIPANAALLGGSSTAGIANGVALGTGLSIASGVLSFTLPLATTGAAGAVRPDGTTISVVNGVITALTGGSGTITGVTAGAGLTGGGTAGSVTLDVQIGTTGGTVAAGNDSRILGAQQTSAKGVANGYAGLDGSGKVPAGNLPPFALASGISASVGQLFGGSGAAGVATPITLGTGLLMTGSTLTATGGAGSGSGTVNSGTIGQLAAYTATGTAVSGIVIGSGLSLSGGTLNAAASGIIAPRIVTAAGGVTVLASDGMVVIKKTTGAATTVTLEATPTPGVTHQIKDGKGDALTNPITIVPNTGTIDGEVNFVLNQAYDSVTLQYNGTEWSVT